MVVSNHAGSLSDEIFIDRSPIAVAKVDRDGAIIDANRSFHRLTRNTLNDRQGIKLVSLLPMIKEKKFSEYYQNAVKKASLAIPLS